MQFKHNGDPMDRFLRYVREMNAPIPKAVIVVMHLCYGDLHHKHFKDPVELSTSVSMATGAQEISPRPINHVQMSVPRHRSDDTYFAPLKNLRFGDGTVYAGLVHYTDGVEGSLRRLAAFKRHYPGTRSGYGMRPRPAPRRPVAEKTARNSSRCRGRDLSRSVGLFAWWHLARVNRLREMAEDSLVRHIAIRELGSAKQRCGPDSFAR
jgi:hypothetical protein